MTALAAAPIPFAIPPLAPTEQEAALLEQIGLHEWVDGRLVEKRMSAYAGRVTSQLHLLLGAVVVPNGLGDLMIEVTFECFPNRPGQARRPDLSFIVAGRTHLVPDEGLIPVPPDLAIEVLSPGDNAYELDRKLEDYQAAGIPLVWVVNPDVRAVRVVRPDGSSIRIDESGTLDGGTVVPEFRAAVRDLFPPRR